MHVDIGAWLVTGYLAVNGYCGKNVVEIACTVCSALDEILQYGGRFDDEGNNIHD